MDELRSLREARDAVDDQIQRMQWGLGPCPPPRTPNPATPDVSPQETIVDAMSSRSLFILLLLPSPCAYQPFPSPSPRHHFVLHLAFPRKVTSAFVTVAVQAKT